MHFTLATIMAVAPLLAAALPQDAHPPASITVPISKRTSNSLMKDGVVDKEALRAHIAHAKGKFNKNASKLPNPNNNLPRHVITKAGLPIPGYPIIPLAPIDIKRSIDSPQDVQHHHHQGSGNCGIPVGADAIPQQFSAIPLFGGPEPTSTIRPSRAAHPVPSDPGSHSDQFPGTECNTVTINSLPTVHPVPNSPQHSHARGSPTPQDSQASSPTQASAGPNPVTTGAVPSSNDQSGKDALTKVSGAWIGTVSVGTPPVEFKVDFDTGSGDFYIPASGCSGPCANFTKYDPGASSTSRTLGQQFFGSFGDGSVIAANAVSDVVSISGLTASNQTFGAATDYLGTNIPGDGLMGLSFQALSVAGAPNFVQTLAEQGVIKQAVFGFKLTSNSSELSIGSPNSALLKGDITFVSVVEKAYWRITADGVSVNGQPAIQSITGIVDTGTTLILGTQEEVSLIYRAIPGAQDASNTLGQGAFTLPCDSTATVSMTFNGKSFDINPQLLILAPVDNQAQTCVGSIIGADVPGINWVFGDVFLQNVYSVFDMDNAQVGFAALA